MDRESYERVCEWFRILVDLPPDERGRKLEQLRTDDDQLAAQVAQMLAADEQASRSHFLSDYADGQPTVTGSSRNNPYGHGEKTNLAGTMIRDYRLEQKIGQGGMGVVYRAYDLNSERFVALKLIRSGVLSDAEHVKRFHSEAVAAAQMQHPNIVPIHDVGRDKDFQFFTMSLVEGLDLKGLLRDGPLLPRIAAGMCAKVARALEYAHQRGVIHRDIKPANILLDADQKPMLTDFGIAKRLDAEADQTRTGQILGTAAYMAPEQIVDAKNVGPAADIYGLGATMYECLTGNAPFASDSVVQLLSDVRNRLPARVRETRPEVSSDLDEICMRCLQKNPADRYGSARQLADDLDHYLAGEPLATTRLPW